MCKRLVHGGGIEPPTYAFVLQCSFQLSYPGTFCIGLFSTFSLSIIGGSPRSLLCYMPPSSGGPVPRSHSPRHIHHVLLPSVPTSCWTSPSVLRILLDRWTWPSEVDHTATCLAQRSSCNGRPTRKRHVTVEGREMYLRCAKG